MKNLKTLKEINWTGFLAEEMVKKLIKAEAIKWVKKYYGTYVLKHMDNIFIKFHNITEEDLK